MLIVPCSARTLGSIASGSAARLLDLCGVATPELPRWGETVNLEPRGD